MLDFDPHHGLTHVIDKGLGPLMCLPHLGSWEWSAYWLTRVRGLPVTAVVERIEPPALFDWFVEFRERIGLHIVPLGPEAGRATVTAVKAGHAAYMWCGTCHGADLVSAGSLAPDLRESAVVRDPQHKDHAGLIDDIHQF